MIDHSALKSAWAGLAAGSNAEKLAALNSRTVPGPKKDISIQAAVDFLIMHPVDGTPAYQTLFDLAGQGSAPAKRLLLLLTTPSIPVLRTSDKDFYGQIGAIVGSLFSSEVAAGFLRLAETTVPWSHANGHGGILNGHDLVAAGINVLILSAATPAGSKTLTFASVPSWVVLGMEVHDLGIDQADIPVGATVGAKGPGIVTITKTITGSGLAAGDQIGFV